MPTQGGIVSVSLTAWILLIIAILAMLAFDLLLHRDGHEIGFREAAKWSIIWVVVGLAAGGVIGVLYGADFWWQYVTGYIVEKSLAVDNVFIWAIIFSYFAVPKHLQHRVLFYGVVGALIFRAILIASGSAILESASWMIYVFGAFLVLTGFKMLAQRNEHLDLADSKILALINRVLPMHDQYVGQKFIVRIENAVKATPLLPVLIFVEVMDIIFAVDSIPAVFAITDEPFIVFASNAFAILGLRAMYFLLGGLMERFIYLKVGLSVILIWVGFKMILSHSVVKIPTGVSLAVIIAILAVTIVASMRATRTTELSNETEKLS